MYMACNHPRILSATERQVAVPKKWPLSDGAMESEPQIAWPSDFEDMAPAAWERGPALHLELQWRSGVSCGAHALVWHAMRGCWALGTIVEASAQRLKARVGSRKRFAAGEVEYVVNNERVASKSEGCEEVSSFDTWKGLPS